MELKIEDHSTELYLKHHIADVNDGLANVGISGVLLLVTADSDGGSALRQVGVDLTDLIEEMAVEVLKRGSGRE